LTLVGKLKKVSWARTVAYCLTLLHVQYVYVRTCLYDTTMVEIARTGPKGPTSKTPFGQSVRSGPVARSRPKTEILVPTPTKNPFGPEPNAFLFPLSWRACLPVFSLCTSLSPLSLVYLSSLSCTSLSPLSLVSLSSLSCMSFSSLSLVYLSLFSRTSLVSLLIL
jgi:hypothetical protein